MATQGKKETGKKNVLTGDPITVGGGGGKKHKKGRITTFNPMYITFADAVYPDPDPNGPKKKKTYTHQSAAYMKSLTLQIGAKNIDLSTLLPADGECSIEVQAKGKTEKITITGSPMSVELHTGKYPPEHGDKHQSNDSSNYIKKVAVDSPLGSYESPKLTGDEKVEIIAGI